MCPECRRYFDTVEEYNEPVVFLGDGVPVYKEEILEKMGDLAILLQHMQTAREQQQSER